MRIPGITAAGRRAHAKFAVARDAAEAHAFDGVPDSQRKLVLGLLARFAEREIAGA
ncbi:hypothetical protein GZH49_07485 [Nocardia terpenica]|uniref:hypothetical protein n=1 Tax=Nocardia terpenica TaxID=455432 RepID=UPI002FE35AC4